MVVVAEVVEKLDYFVEGRWFDPRLLQTSCERVLCELTEPSPVFFFMFLMNKWMFMLFICVCVCELVNVWSTWSGYKNTVRLQ